MVPTYFRRELRIERSNAIAASHFSVFAASGPTGTLVLPAKAGYPVRSGLAVLLRALWNTGHRLRG